MTAYIDVSDVLAAMPVSVRPDESATSGEDVDKLARIASLCASTAEMIDAEITYDFRRHPADPYAADETITVDGRGGRVLHVHRGIIDLTSVDRRYAVTSDWDPYDEVGDYELVSMYEGEDPNRPYDHIHFNHRLPEVGRGVRLTGIFGWQAPPRRLVELNIAWVRQHLAAGDSYSGGAQAPDGYVPQQRLVLPDDVRMFLTREKSRYQECYT